MKVSMKWLRALVDLNGISDEEVAKRLTFAGVEVDSISHLASGTNLVIGEVTSCSPHPNSDHLHILTVNEGEKYGLCQIVCGAPNAREGLKVIVARVGAVLPEITIKKSVIRGVESDGMCCSLLELGVDKKFLSEKQVSGIEELPLDAPVGEENVLGYLGLDDTILELELLANRSDLYAMENIAREVGAIFSRPLSIEKTPEIPYVSSDFEISSETENCPLFGAVIARNIVTAPSPSWMKERLEASGVRSINNVVDIGNYIMLLTGQPLNMYDLDKLPAKSLIVKDKQTEHWVAMDDKNYDIIPGDLCVTSASRTMCLGGVMTSKECAVDEKTKNILIESALFKGSCIRHTSTRLGLSSESSLRFVKGVNPAQCERVLALTSALCQALLGCDSFEKPKLYGKAEGEEKKILTSLSYINKRLGTALEKEEVLNTISRLNFPIEEKGGDSFEVTVPSYRLDISGEEDISEEVIRLLGFERIPSRLPLPEGKAAGYSEKQLARKAVRRHLSSLGLDECLTYTLVNRDERGAFPQLAVSYNRQLINPLTEDRAYVRKSLLPSLLKVAGYNASRQNKDLALFEVSDIPDEENSVTHLAVVCSGEEKLRDALERRPYDFYYVKGIFASVANLLGLEVSRFALEPLADASEDFHPYRSASVTLAKKRIAVFGELHPLAIEKYGLPKHAVALELDLGELIGTKGKSTKAHVPPLYPAVNRDLSFVIGDDVTFFEIERAVKGLDRRIEEVKVFDLYVQKDSYDNHKSMAISLKIRDESKTLVDEEVVSIMNKVMSLLQSKFGAEVRSHG